MTMPDLQQVGLSSHNDDGQPAPTEKHHASLPTSMAWMPLEGLAQTWATFAGTFLTPAAFMATSMVFSALSLEADALRQYSETCHCRCNGDILAARATCEHVIQALQEGSSQWIRALFWLERLAGDQQQHGEQEQARMRALFAETTEQLQRLHLLTFQVQEVGVLLYQRAGLLVGEPVDKLQQCKRTR
jgi:hypothetical protein